MQPNPDIRDNKGGLGTLERESGDPKVLLDRLLASKGVELISHKKHRKYRLPNGMIFVASSSPSDKRGILNNLALLRRLLKK